AQAYRAAFPEGRSVLVQHEELGAIVRVPGPVEDINLHGRARDGDDLSQRSRVRQGYRRWCRWREGRTRDVDDVEGLRAVVGDVHASTVGVHGDVLRVCAGGGGRRQYDIAYLPQVRGVDLRHRAGAVVRYECPQAIGAHGDIERIASDRHGGSDVLS